MPVAPAWALTGRSRPAIFRSPRRTFGGTIARSAVRHPVGAARRLGARARRPPLPWPLGALLGGDHRRALIASASAYRST